MQPVKELQRLYDVWKFYFEPSEDAVRLPLEGDTLREVQEIMKALGHYAGPVHGQLDEATRRAYAALIGNENFEGRIPMEADWIDSEVLAYLRQRVGGGS